MDHRTTAPLEGRRDTDPLDAERSDERSRPRADREQEERPSRSHRDAQESARERQDDARAKAREDIERRAREERGRRAVANVRDPAWWNKASAEDIERMQRLGQSRDIPPAARAAVNARMQHVASTRYGTTVQGAIQHERMNPNQPPPDISRGEGVRRM